MPSSYHASAEWKKFARTARPIVRARLPVMCENGCGRPVYPEQRWDLAHRRGMDAALNPGQTLSLDMVSAAHSRCNRSQGATLGNQLRAKHKATATARDTRQSRLGDR